MEHDRTSANSRAAASAYTCSHAIKDRTLSSRHHCNCPSVERTRVPRPCSKRLAATLDDQPYDVAQFAKEPSKKGTVLYLAYGSNLAYEKFQDPKKGRGIRPLAQINVQVPTLRMTFDLPGIPYTEPCFANSAIRDPENDPPRDDHASEEKPLLSADSRRTADYRKNRWHKGLIGVVYEVTAEDYAHIIATEGGGASYKDVLVDCYPFASDDPRTAVPNYPTTASFKAHTLFAPAVPDGEQPLKDGARFQRPDQSYAQASARYLKLITDGAEECALPVEYREYLESLHSFTITTVKQRMGQAVLVTTWVPLVMLLFGLGKVFADKDGLLPGWLKSLFAAVFKAVWTTYDLVYKPLFGEGERTIGDDDPDKNDKMVCNGSERGIASRGLDLEKATVCSNR
ncbi:Putative gamma-glutamylcyclotransferase [Septoria linicola]|uniref:gamma-glutamylcyclotransferase n=1 Tax=Septoria linicola TaxID=215465 RepID=A0A9Q9B5W7_9PEZI|nr:putative gamma-glutamylcyclotransferase [Septoria linicola]USW57726.1 Putative gamma-glutamylcyclotransferase [Septoria linicola]